MVPALSHEILFAWLEKLTPELRENVAPGG